jgi:integrase
MNRWCARADVPRVTYKDLRRSFCSWMCQAGVPMHHVTRLMGHGSSQMVQRVYGHLAPETYAEAIAKMPRVPTVSQAVVIPIETHRKNGDHRGKDCAENTY